MPNIGAISVTDFVNSGYRSYWEYSNRSGKNAIEPREGIPEVVRRIIYAAYCINIKEHDEHKTIELKGEVAKTHPHGDSSIEDSIKGVATAYKSQPAARILEGVGNFGSAPGDEGAAGRYTSVSGTPLLTAVYRDIPFVPFSFDETGLEQPEYISIPLPMALINGQSAIGTGKSCYVAERDAREVMKWIREMFESGQWDEQLHPAPSPMSVTGCNTWFNTMNGYVYYQAVVHHNVDMNDIHQRGKFDVITNLPPKSTPDSVITKLVQKLPTRASKHIVDGSGKGRPTWIIVPKGYLQEEDFTKYGLQNARKEKIYVWDKELCTMREGSLIDLAKGWFDDRCEVVVKRLEHEVNTSVAAVHRIDLIKEFAEHHMVDWKSEQIVQHFLGLFPETGEQDAALVLGMPARAFLPENLGKNEIQRQKELDKQSILQKEIDRIGEVVLEEADQIIDAQERFFKNV